MIQTSCKSYANMTETRNTPSISSVLICRRLETACGFWSPNMKTYANGFRWQLEGIVASAKAAEIWHRNMGIPMAVSSHAAHRTTRSDDLRMGPSSPEAPDFFCDKPYRKESILLEIALVGARDFTVKSWDLMTVFRKSLISIYTYRDYIILLDHCSIFSPEPWMDKRLAKCTSSSSCLAGVFCRLASGHSPKVSKGIAPHGEHGKTQLA